MAKKKGTKQGTKETEESWAKSKAKKLLKEDIIAGKVTEEMHWSNVYEMRPEYKKFKAERFGPNLKTLREGIARDYARMLKDVDWFGHDMALVKQLRAADSGSIPWHKSDAKYLLDDDITNEVHLKINSETGMKNTPQDMHKSRPEYQQYPLGVFRGHLYQEIKRREKLESKARFGKKKYRCPAGAATDALVKMASEYDKTTEEAEKKRQEKRQKRARKAATAAATAEAQPMDSNNPPQEHQQRRPGRTIRKKRGPVRTQI